MERPLATPDMDDVFTADPVEVEIAGDDDEGKFRSVMKRFRQKLIMMPIWRNSWMSESLTR